MRFKSLLAVLFLGAAYLGSVAGAPAPVVVKAPTDTTAYTHGQCQATAKSTGQRCKRGVSNAGDRFCFQHK